MSVHEHFRMFVCVFVVVFPQYEKQCLILKLTACVFGGGVVVFARGGDKFAQIRTDKSFVTSLLRTTEQSKTKCWKVC